MRIVAGLLLACLAVPHVVWGVDVSKLQYTGYVNDFAGVLSPQARERIAVFCGDVERQTGAQFAVVTIKSLEGDGLEDVANKLYVQWGVGKKTTDEGLLFLLAIEDRKQRAELGYGLESIISDGATGEILRGIRPILRQGDYGAAILAALQQFGGRVAQSKGVTLTGAPPPRRSRGGTDEIPWAVIVFLVLAVIAALGSRGGRGGRGGGGFNAIFLPTILSSTLGGRSSGGWHGGFGGYSGGSSGGGFGGFGGGSAGGGGASSSW